MNFVRLSGRVTNYFTRQINEGQEARIISLCVVGPRGKEFFACQLPEEIQRPDLNTEVTVYGRIARDWTRDIVGCVPCIIEVEKLEPEYSAPMWVVACQRCNDMIRTNIIHSLDVFATYELAKKQMEKWANASYDNWCNPEHCVYDAVIENDEPNDTITVTLGHDKEIWTITGLTSNQVYV